MNLEYKSVRTAGVEAETKGYLELVGLAAGYSTQQKGAFGYELGFGLLGTNAQNVTPKPDWRTTWFYRVTAKGNYTMDFGLFFTAGADALVTFYQDGESYYLGMGALLGVGYRVNDHLSCSITNTNSSVLFAGENYRTLRGQIIEFYYTF